MIHDGPLSNDEIMELIVKQLQQCPTTPQPQPTTPSTAPQPQPMTPSTAPQPQPTTPSTAPQPQPNAPESRVCKTLYRPYNYTLRNGATGYTGGLDPNAKCQSQFYDNNKFWSGCRSMEFYIINYNYK